METFYKNYIDPFPVIPPTPSNNQYIKTSYICDDKKQLKFNTYIGNKVINSAYLGNVQITSAYLGNKQIGTSITVVNDKMMVKLELPICNFLLSSVTTYNVGPVAHTTLNFLYYTVMIGRFYAKDVSPDKTQRNIKAEYWDQSHSGGYWFTDLGTGNGYDIIVNDNEKRTLLTQDFLVYYKKNDSLINKTKKFDIKLSIENCLPSHIFHFNALNNPPSFDVIALKSAEDHTYVKTLAQLPYPYNTVSGNTITNDANYISLTINCDFKGYGTIGIILPNYSLTTQFKMKYAYRNYTGSGRAPESHLTHSGIYSGYDFAFSWKSNEWELIGSNKRKLYFKTQTYGSIPESVIYELTIVRT